MLAALKFFISTITSHLGIALNLFLLSLIKNKSGQALESYRKILYLGAMLDLIYCTEKAIVQPLIVNTEGYYFIVAEGWISFLGHPLAFYFMIFDVYLVYASMTVASVQFIYRLFMICFNTTLNLPAFTLLVSVSLIIPMYFFIKWYLLLFPRLDDIENYAAILEASNMTFWPTNNVFVVNIGTYFFEESKISTLVSVGSYVLIVLCSVAVILKLYIHQKRYNISDRKIQTQISIVLFSEAAVPFCTLILPLQLMSFILVPWLPTFFSFMMALTPIFNPIVKILVITPFRKFVFEKLKGKSETSTMISLQTYSNNNCR